MSFKFRLEILKGRLKYRLKGITEMDVGKTGLGCGLDLSGTVRVGGGFL